MSEDQVVVLLSVLPQDVLLLGGGDVLGIRHFPAQLIADGLNAAQGVIVPALVVGGAGGHHGDLVFLRGGGGGGSGRGGVGRRGRGGGRSRRSGGAGDENDHANRGHQQQLSELAGFHSISCLLISK